MKLFCKHKYVFIGLAKVEKNDWPYNIIKYKFQLQCEHCTKSKEYFTSAISVYKFTTRHIITENQEQELKLLKTTLINKLNNKYNLNIKI